MKKCIAIFILIIAFLSGCTVDENGIRDPVSEAKAQATRTQTETDRKAAEIDLSIKEQTAYQEVKTKEAELKIKQLQAEADAHRQQVMADAEAEAQKQTLVLQAQTQAEVGRAFGFALSAVIVIGSFGLVFWLCAFSYSRSRNSILSSGIIKIGVDPLTLQAPPLLITHDGYMLDTRTGERARLRDAASVNRMRIAATTQITNLAILSERAEAIAKSTHDPRPADILPSIAQVLPTLEIDPPSPDRDITQIVKEKQEAR